MNHWKKAKLKAKKRERILQQQAKNEYVGGIIYDHKPWYLKNDPVFTKKVEPKYSKPDTSMILTAKNEFMEGTAIYERKDGFWRLKDHSVTLSFLKGKDPANAKHELLKRGFDYKWG